jgi:AcrR family transcriptional regulator
MATTTRKTADERREQILTAARHEFALRGLHGASTDAIARAAGISQPYLFRLFGTKKELFRAATEQCFRRTYATFVDAVARGDALDPLGAMGAAYHELIASDPDLLRAQMQAYAACDDPEVCATVRDGFRSLVELAERVSGRPAEEVWRFFANGMLINVLASMGMSEQPQPWFERLFEGCQP